jgi:hypothetical protein
MAQHFEDAILLYSSSRNSILFLKLFLVLVILFASFSSADAEPPSLITDPLIPVTPELLKRGVYGHSTVKVGIDTVGSVESCIVFPSGNHAFDSLVKCKVAAARFTPATENGRAVSSTVNFEIAVPCDSLVAQCLRLPPNFVGTAVDTELMISLPRTRLLLHYTDTTEDSALTIGFDRYLSLIGSSSRQKYDGKLLVAVTDSLGRFSFRLLPRGHFRVSVQSSGYDIGQFQGFITGDEPQQCRFVLRPSKERFHDSTYVIMVYGHQTFSEENIVVAEGEKHTGFSPFLSNVVQAKAEIRRVPEGPSMMLVRSGCPYDNMYVVAGVPMLAPFHFGGYPYADIDGLMISALTTVKVTINDIAAKRLDASGCIVEADPGKIKYDNDSIAKGFYLKSDISTIGMDFLAAYSAKKKTGDFVQVGYSVSNDYQIIWDNQFYPSVSRGNQGIGIPISYGNATLTGSKSIGPFRCTAFGWFAWDLFNVLEATTIEAQRIRDSLAYLGKLAGNAFFPWGMGSITFSADSSKRSFIIGGSRQFFGTGKRIDTNVFATRSFLNNGEITADFDTIIRTPFVTKLSARISHDEWNGFLSQQENDSIDTVFRAHGTETGANFNISLIKQAGRLTAECDLLASAIKYTGSFQLTGDAGLSVNYGNDDYNAGFHLGRITSRPDIRGLPDSLFRMQLDRTYIASLPLFFRYGMVTKIGVEPYFRYSTNSPQLDPITKTWDPNKSTPVLARGIDFDCRIVPTPWSELHLVLNLADARRNSTTDNSLAYEWNLPWTIRTSLHIHSQSDRFQFYVDYIRMKGLPYYDFDNQAYVALPVYRSLDFNFQVRTLSTPRWFICKLDCYMTFKNVQDLFRVHSNVRDYYWDRNGNRKAIYLGYGRLDIGTRFGIKL